MKFFRHMYVGCIIYVDYKYLFKLGNSNVQFNDAKILLKSNNNISFVKNKNVCNKVIS